MSKTKEHCIAVKQAIQDQTSYDTHRAWFAAEVADAFLSQDRLKMREIRAEICDLIPLASRFRADRSWKTLSDLLTLGMECGLPLVQYKLCDIEQLSGKIIAALLEYPGSTSSELAERIGSTPYAVRKDLEVLYKNGLVHKLKRGKRTEWHSSHRVGEVIFSLPSMDSIQKLWEEKGKQLSR